jgi:hypothetical protein
MPQAQDHPHLHPPVRTHKMQLVTKGRLKFCKHSARNQELAVEDWVKDHIFHKNREISILMMKKKQQG